MLEEICERDRSMKSTTITKAQQQIEKEIESDNSPRGMKFLGSRRCLLLGLGMEGEMVKMK
jgi:hypothetical protein